jgi:hypothetical protein
VTTPPTVLTNREASQRFGSGRTRWAVDSGRWQRPSRGVVVTHNGPLSPEEQLHVAVRSAPRGSVLSGPTAAALGGLRGFESTAIHLTIPHRSRWVDAEGIVIHRSAILTPDLVQGDPARTRIERSVIDSASWTSAPRRARAIVMASVQQRLTTPARLLEALGRRGNLAGTRLVRESVLDAAGGLESVPEAEFALLLKREGIPDPVRQVAVLCPAGRYRLDAVFDPPGVAVEIDGAHHRDPTQSDADLRRQNELLIEGRPLLRFSSFEVRHEPRNVAMVIRRALHLPTFVLP